MNKTFYNRALFALLLFSDTLSGYTALYLIPKNSFLNNIFINYPFEFFGIALLIQLFWFPIFYIANLYDTRATLSRFEEIIKIVPIIYTCLIILISCHVLDLFQ